MFFGQLDTNNSGLNIPLSTTAIRYRKKYNLSDLNKEFRLKLSQPFSYCSFILH